MTQSIVSVALVVRDYDEAIAFFTQALRFTLIEDTDMGHGKRWVVVAPSTMPAGGQGAALLLAKAVNDEQLSRVGNQTGGRVFLFLHTHDFEGDYAHMQAHGVKFAEAPREEVYGRVVVFYDLYGNKWDMIQPKGKA